MFPIWRHNHMDGTETGVYPKLVRFCWGKISFPSHGIWRYILFRQIHAPHQIMLTRLSLNNAVRWHWCDPTWRFPEMELPLVIIHFNQIFHYSLDWFSREKLNRKPWCFYHQIDRLSGENCPIIQFYEIDYMEVP